MPTIASANASNIRPPMQVFCGLTYTGVANLSFEVEDAKVYGSLKNDEPANLTDLAGDGFPLDGSCVEYTSGIAGIGARTDVGGLMTITVSANKSIPGITLRCIGEGEIHIDDAVYDVRDGLVLPVDGQYAVLDVYAAPGNRVVIWNIDAGITLAWSNEDLISVVVALRSDLSVVEQDLQTSDIEIKAYWPEDIREAVTAIGDNAPLWYYAGYPGDYSKTRTFYVCQEIEQVDNIITIKGEDAMGRLDYETDAALLTAERVGPARDLYNVMLAMIRNAGISPAAQSRPAAQAGKGRLIFPEATAAEIVASIMHLAHSGTFWPVYVDAGIPTLTWRVPTAKWDIYEEDCGEVSIELTRNVKTLTPEDKTYGIGAAVSEHYPKDPVALIGAIDEVSSHPETLDFDGYWEDVQAYGKIKLASATLTEAVYEKGTTKASAYVKKWLAVAANKEALGDSPAAIFGRQIAITAGAKKITDSRLGITETIEVLPLGTEYFDTTGTEIAYPRYARIFEISNETGAFTWKGNPKMQPRDIFRFHRLDGTVYACTIEEIILTHEGGGLTAEIRYRKGVV